MQADPCGGPCDLHHVGGSSFTVFTSGPPAGWTQGEGMRASCVFPHPAASCHRPQAFNTSEHDGKSEPSAGMSVTNNLKPLMKLLSQESPEPHPQRAGKESSAPGGEGG